MADKKTTPKAPGSGRKRLDILVVEQGLSKSREQAQGRILAGEIWTGETRLEKPGMQISTDTVLSWQPKTPPFASRGGEKLAHALQHFQVSVKDCVCLDIGASTGGFTDCLLKAGAEAVFCVDVGYGQLDFHLRNHPAVINFERTNARNLTREMLLEKSEKAARIDTIVMDVSFISLRKIIEPLNAHFQFSTGTRWILLFKPQFEVGPEHVLKGGIVKDETAIQAALEEFRSFAESQRLRWKGGPENSPITGKKSGNLEFLLFYENI